MRLALLPITPEAFAPYGWVAEASPSNGSAGRFINDGSSWRVEAPGGLSLHAAGGAPGLAIFRAQARDPAGPWRVLERHRLGTQTFVPMGGARYVVLVASGDPPPGAPPGAPPPAVPDPATLAAFAVGGHQIVTLRPGTWHHGLIALDAGDFAVIERIAPDVDCELASLPEPVWLG